VIWPALTLLLALTLLGGVILHLRQKRRLEEREARVRRELEDERTRHQQLLAHEHAQQQALFNSMVEGVLLLGGDGRIRLVNQALERMFGLTVDIRGRTILEAFRLHELQELMNRAVIEGQVLDYELELPVLDRRCLQVNAAAFLNHEGRQQGVILVFHDVTRLKQLENTRKEFVANVSHELRTPLSLIKGYVETLIDGAKNDPEVATRFLQTIEKHTDRLTYLIEDLLTISRLESGQVVMNVQSFELRPVAQRVLDDLHARAAEKQAQLINEIPAGLKLRADADRLQQVFFNLVDNAIKYGPVGGRVEVGARSRADGAVEVWVRDNGPGIPAEAKERVFERFYRVDRARSRDQGGTGLGLAIVKHIVQSHHGEVWVESELEKGATFHFTVPTA
jgi:two-component system phosphate regulon sensor histidine kinase PhoR